MSLAVDPSRLHACAPPAEALWLSEAQRAVFVMLHRPAESSVARASAVLMCPPFGWAESCAYQDLRHWGDELARAGFACARVSWPGVGNSAGTPRDDGLFEAWVQAVTDAARWLRCTTEATRLAVAGVGVGGLLACLAAGRGAPIDDFILWGVPSRGRALVREEILSARVVTGGYTQAIAPELGPGEGLQLVGYHLSAQVADAVGAVRLDPRTMPSVSDRRVLLVGRDGMAVDPVLAEGFAAGGAQVTELAGPDWGDLIGPPQHTAVPSETIARTVAWLKDGPPVGLCAEPSRPRGGHPEGVAPASSLAEPSRSRGGHPGAVAPAASVRATQAALVDARGEVRERAVRFTGEIAGHFAVIAEPARVPALGLTAVLCSAHHAGPNRMFVELARRWAARGVTTVRLDLQGLGETRGPLPRPLPDAALYSTQLERHLPAALEQLATAGLPPRFILGGYCAGAYWALQAALSVDRVAAAMVINLYAVTYSPQLVAERGAVEDLEGLGGRAWQRLRQGRVTSGDLRRVARRIRTGYLGAGGTRPAERAQRVHTAQALDRLRERDVQTLVVLAEDEPLVGQLRQAGALAQTNPWPNVAVDVIPGRDHLMLQLEVQRLVHASLDRALVRLLAG